VCARGVRFVWQWSHHAQSRHCRHAAAAAAAPPPLPGRQWVPVHLAAAANLQQSIASYLHADGSCGPVGSKQKVLLDLQCRGFAVAVRWAPGRRVWAALFLLGAGSSSSSSTRPELK
jgi:hypothetical protein